jgi:hypothetical protein
MLRSYFARSTWSKSSTTSMARPKMLTLSLTRFLSKSRTTWKYNRIWIIYPNLKFAMFIR